MSARSKSTAVERLCRNWLPATDYWLRLTVGTGYWLLPLWHRLDEEAELLRFFAGERLTVLVRVLVHRGLKTLREHPQVRAIISDEVEPVSPPKTLARSASEGK